MNKITNLLAAVSILCGSETLLPSVMNSAAHAQADGDKKCSPDGYIMTYNTILKSWSTSFSNRCGGGNYSGSRDDGDEKCGPDGYILKYEAQGNGRWKETARKCK
ncbi:hypothetical protein [Novosphingobium sp. Rr 2-17]|uniref:hypothetical protein n=1 Tax=Novosphingobium sp. Rr 2-17 TaxID=555793 RepID=UPI0012F6BB87|nr:hypothetical protein [Novosphingobium sp. Rr 2-17]